MRWEYAFWVLILWLFVWQPSVRSVGRIRSSVRRRQERLQNAVHAARAAARDSDWQAVLTECDRAQALLSRLDIIAWLEHLAQGYASLRQARKDVAAARCDVHYYRAVALEHLGQLDRAMTEYDQCMVADRNGNPNHAVLVYLGQGSSLARLGRWAQSEAKLSLCLATLQESPEPQLSLRALRTLALVCLNTHRPEEALQHMQKALDAARSLDDEYVAGQLLDALGDMTLTLGRPEEALRNYELSLDVFRRLGHRAGLSTVQRDIAHLYQAQGDWTRSMAWLRVCLREAELGEDLANQAMTTYEMGCLHMMHGDLGEAHDLLTRSMGLFRRGQDKHGVSHVGSTLMGLGITMHRQATADRMTYGDIVRGSTRKMEEGES